MPIMKSKATGEEFDVPDSERNEALATGKFDEFYLMKSKADGEEFMVPAQELGDAMNSGKLELTEVYNQRKDIEANPTEATNAPISKTDSALTGAVAGVTLGFDDEIYGGLRGLREAATTDKSLSDAYSENRDKYRDMKHRASEENPWSYGAGNLAGGLVLPFGAGKAAGTMIGAVSKGALVGAGTGAVQAVGDNENHNELLGDVAQGTAVGGVLGGAAGGIGRIVGKGVTKSGRAELGKELEAFHAGRDSVTANGLLDEPRRIWAGLRETVNSEKAQQELFNFLKGSKVNTVSRMVEDGAIPPSQEKAMLNFMDKLSDEEYILMKLQEGDPEVSNWIAKQSGGNVAEKQKFLAKTPEERQALRSLDLKDDAKQLTPIAESAKDHLWSDATNKIEGHTATARESFNNSMQNYLYSHSNASEDLESMGKLVGSGPAKHVDLSFEMITQGTGGRVEWDLRPNLSFRDAPSDIQFNRLQKAREIVDEGIDWDKINAKIRKPTQGEKILIDYRASIDEILKSTPGKSEADAAYRIATELDDMIFGKTEFKGSVDPYKIKRLLNNTDDANRFRDGLDRLKEWSESADPQAKAAADQFLLKFKELFKKKTESDALNNLSREGGPSALQIQRLDRSMKGDTSITKHAVKQTADFLGKNEDATAFIQEVIGKPFSEMTPKEKTAFVRVYIQYAKADYRGTADAINNNFIHELNKIK